MEKFVICLLPSQHVYQKLLHVTSKHFHIIQHISQDAINYHLPYLEPMAMLLIRYLVSTVVM
jgi:hypothetical protein